MNIRTFILFFLTLPFSVAAQETIKGIVKEAGNGTPVDAATVQLFEAGKPLPVSFTLSNARGEFTLPVREADDSLTVRISLLGYKTAEKRALPGATLQFDLNPEIFSLKEVEIRPGRIYGRQDTINYDVTQFLTPKDESIKDVLKKLPGVDVDEAGKISYNGKAIKKLYVEGMDISDGRYGQITNNLRADAVESAQILENHQPIRALQKKLTTEDIALNLKLKPTFRDRWMITAEGGLGASPLLWKGIGNAMQLSRGSQSIYLYKGNNTGGDVTEEQNVLTMNGREDKEGPSIPGFLNQPSFSAPLKKERMLFNDVHTLSGNRLYKLNETTQLRLNANYLHDLSRQQRGSESYYYQAGDTAVLSEESDTRIRRNRGEVTLTLENNAESHYLTNDFNLTGDWANSLSHITDGREINQRIQTRDMGIRNYLQSFWTGSRYTVEARSLLRYHNRPDRIILDQETKKMPLQQLYIDHSVSLIRKKGYLTRQYTAGITGDINSVKNGMKLYIKPNYQWNVHKWNTTFALPLTWTAYPDNRFSRFTPNPMLYITYKLNYAWKFSAHASYNESYGSPVDFYPEAYRINYRSQIEGNGIMPVRRDQSYSLYGEYKNTIREFFVTLNMSHSRGWSDRILEQAVRNGEISLISHRMPNRSQSWTVNGTLSKGFYDYGLKTSLSYLLGRSDGEQLSAGRRLRYRSDYMQYEPKIVYTPFRRFEISYQATLYFGGSRIGDDTRLSPLLNVVQKAQLYYELTPVEINLSLDHYHNDVSATKAIDAFFADLSLRWKTRKWQFTAEAKNLFNKKEYRYTQYSATESYTSWIRIRPREFLFSARYKF